MTADHKCLFPCNPPGGSFFAPGPCGTCGKTYARSQAEQMLAEAVAAMSATEPGGMQAERDLTTRQPQSPELDRKSLTGFVDVHFIGNGPYPPQLVCLTEDASDVECGHEIAEVGPGANWGELEALISAHAAECHAATTIPSL